MYSDNDDGVVERMESPAGAKVRVNVCMNVCTYVRMYSDNELHHYHHAYWHSSWSLLLEPRCVWP
jgi:hypothetical protein